MEGLAATGVDKERWKRYTGSSCERSEITNPSGMEDWLLGEMLQRADAPDEPETFA